MEKNLAQAEIDALFASVNAQSSNEETESPATKAEPVRRQEAYNFSRAGQISNDQMKAISTVNDLFARTLTHNLGAWLRTQFHVALVSGEQMVYQEYLERVPEMAYLCSARLEPLDVLGVIQMDLTVAPPI